jgi:hypothetical protein
MERIHARRSASRSPETPYRPPKSSMFSSTVRSPYKENLWDM